MTSRAETSPPEMDLRSVREQFPALERSVDGKPALYLDGPAGSQVPLRVAQAVQQYLVGPNANEGGYFATSRETGALVDDARELLSTLLGAPEAQGLVFGANMTSLCFALSRALSRTWRSGDEVLVTDSEHDANYSPWVLAAERAGAQVQRIALTGRDGRLDLDDFHKKLSERTRLVAVGLASNATGTVHPVQTITEAAHELGAQVFVDAVHYAPHRLVDIETLGCDYLAASVYKFFGPHVGLLWGRPELLAELPTDTVRPADYPGPGRWMTGTPNLEGIAGAAEAVRYLASLAGGADDDSLRVRLERAFQAIEQHEGRLVRRLLDGLARRPDFEVIGITKPEQLEDRVPTVSLTHRHLSPETMARQLAAQGIFVWSGNHYALPLTEALGLEPEGTLRIGFLHYNTEHEVDRLLAALDTLH